MKIRLYWPAFALALSIQSNLYSQQPGAVQTNKYTTEDMAMLDGLFSEVLEIVHKADKKGMLLSKADGSKELIAFFNSQGEFRTRRDKMLGNDFSRPIVFKAMPGESSRINWLKGIPVPQMPEPALQADPRENEKYAEKLKKAQEQVQEEARKLAGNTQLVQTHQKGGNEAVLKMYENQANQNPLIAQMGGAEKLQKMSEAERKAAANQAVMQRTGGYTAEQIQKMSPAEKKALAQQMAQQAPAGEAGQEVAQAFTRELMVNADLRKRYESMSDAEKQAFYREYAKRYNGTDVVENNKNRTAAPDARSQEAKEIMIIEKFAEDFRKDLEQSLAPIKSRVIANETLYSERMKRLQQWAEAETEKLPVVSDSEYGEHPEGLDKVDYARHLLTYYIARDRISRDREIWEAKLNAMIPAIKKLDDFAASYEKRTDMTDQLRLAVAGARAGGYETILELNREAGYITSSAAGIQYQYNCLVLKQCDDPRAAKYQSQQ